MGRLLRLSFVGVFVYRLSVSPGPFVHLLSIPARALLIGYTPVACFHRVFQTENYLQYAQFILCCSLAAVSFARCNNLAREISVNPAKTRQARRLASLSLTRFATKIISW